MLLVDSVESKNTVYTQSMPTIIIRLYQIHMVVSYFKVHVVNIYIYIYHTVLVVS
jgi:hypothetical protein